MKRVNVSEAKNGFSGLLREVRRRERPGVRVPPRPPLDVERFLDVPPVRLTGGTVASEIIVDERGGA